jgi:hypothetical protein
VKKSKFVVNPPLLSKRNTCFPDEHNCFANEHIVFQMTDRLENDRFHFENGALPKTGWSPQHYIFHIITSSLGQIRGHLFHFIYFNKQSARFPGNLQHAVLHIARIVSKMSITKQTSNNGQTKEIFKHVERHYAMASAAQKPVFASVQTTGPVATELCVCSFDSCQYKKQITQM